MAEENVETKTFRRLTCCQPFIYLPIIWSLVSSAVLVAVGLLHILKENNNFIAGIVYIAVGSVVFSLEFLSILIRIKCCRRIECCLKCITSVGWFDTWKRGGVYLLIGIVFIILFHHSLLNIVCGLALIFGGSLYVLKTCRVRGRTSSDRNQLVEDFVEEQKAEA